MADRADEGKAGFQVMFRGFQLFGWLLVILGIFGNTNPFTSTYIIHYHYHPKYQLSHPQVRYEVRETNIGKGLFLLEPVAKGALIWRWEVIIITT